MKYYLLRVLLCLFFLSSPLLANDEEPLNPIQDLETEILSTKIPQGYEIVSMVTMSLAMIKVSQGARILMMPTSSPLILRLPP